MIFISLSLQGFFFLWEDQCFSLNWLFLSAWSFGSAQVLFQCRSCLQTICSSCLWKFAACCLLDPSLKPPNIFFPFHLCTRPLHHTTCFRGAGVHLASCLCLFHVWHLGSISSVCRTPVSSVLSVWGEVNHSQSWCLGWGLRLAPVALSAPLGLALLHRKPQST